MLGRGSVAGGEFRRVVYLDFGRVFFWHGGSGVLQGFLRISGCSVMVNRGEVVVDCVVNVDRKLPLLAVEK
jgi:hypothetical protein